MWTYRGIVALIGVFDRGLAETFPSIDDLRPDYLTDIGAVAEYEHRLNKERNPRG